VRGPAARRTPALARRPSGPAIGLIGATGSQRYRRSMGSFNVAELETRLSCDVAAVEARLSRELAEVSSRLTRDIAAGRVDLVKWAVGALTVQTALLLGASKLF
jgi:hypothetical protein